MSDRFHSFLVDLHRASERIPMGASVSIKGAANISAYNFAQRIHDLLVAWDQRRDIYPLICDEPPRPAPIEPDVADLLCCLRAHGEHERADKLKKLLVEART